MRSQLLLLISLLCQPTRCWRSSGLLPSAGQFTEYVGKFCFDYKPVPPDQPKPAIGQIEVHVRGVVLPRTSMAPQSTEGPPCWGPCESPGRFFLIVFDDEEAHGQIVKRRWGKLSCEEMLHRKSFAFEIDLSTGRDFRKTVEVHESIRPRFWYFTFAACDVDVEIAPFYEIHAVNTLQGFEREFGMDQLGLLHLQIAAAAFFLGLGFSLRLAGRAATGTEALRSRPLLRILLVSAFLSAAAGSCLSLHWAFFASDGWGVGWVEVVGTGFVVVAKALLSILQLLLAKGWALLYSPQQLLQRQLMVCLLGLIIVISVGCEIHATFFHDWSAQIYVYESWPGTAVLALNTLLFLEAWRSMRETIQLEVAVEVRNFYVSIFAVSILYFLTLPVVVALATLLDPWVRAKYVDRVEVLCRFLATSLLGFLLRPTRMDALINARMEEGNGMLGEPCDDFAEEAPAGQIVSASGSVPLRGSNPGSPKVDEAKDMEPDGSPAE